jgi:hypothetical protein
VSTHCTPPSPFRSNAALICVKWYEVDAIPLPPS